MVSFSSSITEHGHLVETSIHTTSSTGELETFVWFPTKEIRVVVALCRKRMASWVSSATSTKIQTNTDTKAPTQKVQRQDPLRSKC